jgi:outer membrane protein OmpA-like peptidoglycan-associated protein
MTSRKSTIVAAAAVLTLAVGAGAASPRLQPEIARLLDEFAATSETLAEQPAGAETLTFLGPDERPNWFQALVVTHEENPLLEEECKHKAFSLSLETLREAHGFGSDEEALRMAEKHMRERQDFARSHDVSYADYLAHLAECRAFCGPVVAHLMECQVLAISRNPHGIVLFEIDSDRVDARYDEGVLDRAAGILAQSPDRKIALVGRASRIGDLRYNRRLSARRALAVRDRLLEQGVEAERIKTMWLGWEPPQIGPWIAAEYGFDDLLDERGPVGVNQSVIVAVY